MINGRSAVAKFQPCFHQQKAVDLPSNLSAERLHGWISHDFQQNFATVGHAKITSLGYGLIPPPKRTAVLNMEG